MIKALRLFAVVAVASVTVIPAAWAETFTLARADGSKITYYLDTPAGEGFPVLVFLHGSQCGGAQEGHDRYKPFVTPLGMAVLSVEKRGFPSKDSGTCPAEYLENNTVDGRVSDYLAVVSFLRQNLNGWNKRLFLLGGSEGGTVASLLAPLLPETSATILLASGGGMTMAEEMLLLTEKELRAKVTSEAEIKEALRAMRVQMDEIRANPTSAKTWLGETNTYKWWASILEKEALTSLQTVKTPIYLIHGTADQSVPIESADLLAQKLKEQSRPNFTYVRYEGLDHHFMDRQGNSKAMPVLTSAVIWLMVQVDQEIRSRLMEVYRKNPNDPELPALLRQMSEIDHRNTEVLKQFIAMTGFPLISTHDAQANRNAWLLVQHADHDLAFQKQVLSILEEAFEKKDTHAPDVAYLKDRVMVNDSQANGREPHQLFGSQGRPVQSGCWEPWPIDDREQVDERRSAYGLGPLAEYVRQMNEYSGKPECNK